MRACALLLLIPLLAACGGWHPLYSDPANPQADANYTATIGNGTVTPASGSIATGSLVTFTATPSSGFECVTYTVNGGPAVNCAPASPSAAGGDPVTVAIPISQDPEAIAFQTVASGTTHGFHASIPGVSAVAALVASVLLVGVR